MLYRAFGYAATDRGVEPTLFVARGRRAVGVPLSIAHEFLDDGEAVRRCFAYCVRLFGGLSEFTRGELLAVIRLVTEGIGHLIAMPPPPETPFGRQVERDRLVVRADGEELLDAS